MEPEARIAASLTNWFCVAGLFVGLSLLPAHAAVSFSLITGDPVANTQSLVIDSNKCPAEGPVAAYVAGTVTNTGASSVTRVAATLSGLTGSFSLTGSQGPTIDLGALAPGAQTIAGWHITYPCTDATPITLMVSTSDDAGASDTDLIVATTRSSQSANSAGNVLSTTLGSGAVVGQIISADVNYDFGNIGNGDEFILQPAGKLGFDAACFRLVATEVISSNINGIMTGQKNLLFFISPAKQSGNGYFVNLRYFYRYLCAGVTTAARPYAAQTSGASNIKYTGNFDGTGALEFNFTGASNPFTITKSASPSPLLQGAGPHITTYTVTVSNPSAYDTLLDSFDDVLPAGIAFDAIEASSGVTAANSAATPATGATGAISFVGLTGSSYALPASSDLTLVYSTTVTDVAGDYLNSVTVNVGSETIGPATTTVTVANARLNVSKQVNEYDPSAAGLHMTPGNDVVYTIFVENTGPFAADPDSVILVDDMPGEVEFFNNDFDPASPGMGPFDFDPGASGLTCCDAGDIEYSNSTGASPVFGYVPAGGYDGAVSYIKLNPKGNLQPGESFSVKFRARIE